MAINLNVFLRSLEKILAEEKEKKASSESENSITAKAESKKKASAESGFKDGPLPKTAYGKTWQDNTYRQMLFCFTPYEPEDEVRKHALIQMKEWKNIVLE